MFACKLAKKKASQKERLNFLHLISNCYYQPVLFVTTAVTPAVVVLDVPEEIAE